MKPAEISKTTQRLKYACSDFITGALAFWIFNMVRYALMNDLRHSVPTLWAYLGMPKLIIEQCVAPLVMLGIYWLSGYYNRPFQKSRLEEFNLTFWSAVVNTVIIYLVLLINDQTGKRIINYELIIILFGLLFLIPYIGRLIITARAIYHFRKDIWHVNVLILGNSKVARKVARKVSSYQRETRFIIKGFVDIPGENAAKDSLDSFPLDKIKEVVKALDINLIVLAPENHDDKKVLKLLSVLFPLDLPVKISPDTFSYVTSAIRLADIYGEPFIDLTGPAIGEASKNIKRTFDITFSILVLLLLSPLLAFLGVAVKLSSKGPVIYRQERIGLHQKPFKILKFRSMVENAEHSGPQLSSDNDPRITKVGHWMRKYRLDELPQFWNVIKGDMSIVGPRPEREFYIQQIVKEAPYYTLVCQVRPGITSWGMVKYGYASTVKEMVERTRFDLLYLANMSLSLDCKIMIYTVKTIVGGEGL